MTYIYVLFPRSVLFTMPHEDSPTMPNDRNTTRVHPSTVGKIVEMTEYTLARGKAKNLTKPEKSH